MTLNQKNRLTQLSLIGCASSVISVWIVDVLVFRPMLPNVDVFESMLSFYISAGIGTFIAIQLMWRFMIKRKTETRKRGVIYGFMAGFLCLFLMSVIYTVGAVLGVFDNDEISKNINVALFSPIFFTGIFLLFGGFLAPVFGALLGYVFSRNL